MNYKEQLRHPKWQKKRLEIMNRDNFKCRNCDTSDEMLNVHHIFYDNEAENPWSYPNECLITLCCDCHSQEHEHGLKDIGENIIKKIVMLSNKPLSYYDIDLDIYLLTEKGFSIENATKEALMAYIKNL